MGFTLAKSRSRRHPTVTITDTDFVDDLALISNTLEQVQLFLLRLESAAAQVGLHINEIKTVFVSYNQPEGDLVTLKGNKLKQVEDFVYLGSWVNSSKKDIEVRIAMAWSALGKMDTIWKSKMNKQLKIQFFRSTAETVLLYGSSSWTLTKSLTTKLSDTYTRLIRAALNVSWRQHMTNKNYMATYLRYLKQYVKYEFGLVATAGKVGRK